MPANGLKSWTTGEEAQSKTPTDFGRRDVAGFEGKKN
jgi:hypothetical protein